MEKYKIIIFGEMMRNENIAPVSYELTAKASELVKETENAEIQVLIVGKRINYDKIIDEFSKYGADKVTIVNDDVLEEYSSEKYRKAVCEIIEKEKPQIVLIGATAVGRDLAPLVATTLKTGLTADCTGLEITEGKLAATRPTFGGKMNATIMCKTLPQMATVRPCVFKLPSETTAKDTIVDFNWIDTSDQPEFTKILEFIPQYKNGECNLNEAEIIVAGGRGLKNKENFDKLYELATLLKGAVGASRGAVEAGFADSSIQIGQTGKTVCSKIYIAFGISGMAQHMAGINSCDKILSINKDSNAPIFKMSDYGIVGDATEILELMIEKLKNSMEMK